MYEMSIDINLFKVSCEGIQIFTLLLPGAIQRSNWFNFYIVKPGQFRGRHQDLLHTKRTFFRSSYQDGVVNMEEGNVYFKRKTIGWNFYIVIHDKNNGCVYARALINSIKSALDIVSPCSRPQLLIISSMASCNSASCCCKYTVVI